MAGFAAFVTPMSGTYGWSQTPLKSGRQLGSLGAGPVGGVHFWPGSEDWVGTPAPMVPRVRSAWAHAQPGCNTSVRTTSSADFRNIKAIIGAVCLPDPAK